MRTLAGACLFILLAAALTAELVGPDATIITLLIGLFVGLFVWLLSGGAR